MSDAEIVAGSGERNAFFAKLAASVARFPLAIAGAVTLTIFLILVAEDYRDWERDFEFVLRVTATLVCGALWSVGAVLIAEERGWTRSSGVLLGAVGALVLALLFWFHRELDVVEYGLVTALILFVGLAPYLSRGVDNRAVWEFNHDVWIGAGFATLAAALVGGGASAILGTLEYLFKLEIRRELWGEVWIVAAGLVGPLYWLNAIPKRFDVQVGEGDQKDAELTTRMITVLVKYILVPLLLIYTAILYVYAAKIGVGWELPKGRLGYMVSTFGVVGIVTALLAFPSRDHAGALVRFFWRHWFWLMLVPLALLFIGAWRRISDYGLTQERYTLVLVGVWLLAVALLFGLRFLSRDLRLVPGLLAGLLAVTSVGPWSAEGLPLRSLMGELRGLLDAEGSLDENGVLKAKTALSAKRAGETSRRMVSIVGYFRRQNRLDRLRPLFGAEADAVLGTFDTERARQRARYKTAQAVMSRLVLSPEHISRSDTRYFSFNGLVPRALTVPAASTLYGPLRLHSKSDETPKAFKSEDPSIVASLEGDILRIAQNGVQLGHYNVRSAAETAVKQQHKRNGAFLQLAPLPASGGSQLLVMEIYGHFNAEDHLRLRNLTVWIVTPKAE